MIAERRKLARLHRLERARAIAKQGAASEAARAESTLMQLQALAQRSNELAADYRARRDATDGSELRRLGVFATSLHGVCRNTGADAARARATADRKQRELAEAERRRAAVADRAATVTHMIARLAQTPALGRRRKPGGE